MKNLILALGLALCLVMPSQAIVTTTTNTVSYLGNGITTAYSVPFKVLDKTDLKVTVDGVVKTYITDYTVSLLTNSATVNFLAAPATPLAITITRIRDFKQGQTFRVQGPLNLGTLENTFDDIEMQIQQILTASVFSGYITPTGGNTPQTLENLFAQVGVNARAYGAVADGSTNVADKINSALANNKGIVYLPASSSCYYTGTTTLVLGSGDSLRGAGMGGASAGASCIRYTGTGCAILIDSVSFAGVYDLDVQVDSASATAAGICLQSGTLVAEFNTIERVSIRQTNAVKRVVGQYGLYLNDTGNGIFWNQFSMLRASGWDVAFRLFGGTVQGTNDNDFRALMGWGSSTVFRITSTNSTAFAGDNMISGLKCSRSDGTLVGNVNCLMIGDDGTATFGNQFYGVVSDIGAPSTCGTIGAFGRASTIFITCESGSPITDGAINTPWPNFIFDPIPGKVRTPALIGISATGNGVSAAALILGQVPFSGVSGVRIRSSRVVQANKGVPVDCAGANLGPTVSSILDFSIYTCATAQTLTLPTAQGAAGLVQNLPGNGTSGTTVAGDIFQFYMSSTAAANFTLVAGVGTTIVGNAVINNGMKLWLCRVTSVVAGAETISCY